MEEMELEVEAHWNLTVKNSIPMVHFHHSRRPHRKVMKDRATAALMYCIRVLISLPLSFQFDFGLKQISQSGRRRRRRRRRRTTRSDSTRSPLIQPTRGGSPRSIVFSYSVTEAHATPPQLSSADLIVSPTTTSSPPPPSPPSSSEGKKET